MYHVSEMGLSNNTLFIFLLLLAAVEAQFGKRITNTYYCIARPTVDLSQISDILAARTQIYSKTLILVKWYTYRQKTYFPARV